MKTYVKCIRENSDPNIDIFKKQLLELISTLGDLNNETYQILNQDYKKCSKDLYSAMIDLNQFVASEFTGSLY